MSEIENNHSHNITDPDEDTIDLIALAKTLWEGRKTVILTVAIFAVLGVFVAIFSPVEYEAKTILVPQVQSKSSGMGGLSSLAALAGFNLDAMQGGSAELSPMIYPQIVQSIPFQRTIIHTPIKWENYAEPVDMLFYSDSLSKSSPLGIIKKYTIGLPGVIIKLIKGTPEDVSTSVIGDGTIVSLSKEEKAASDALKSQLSIDVNSKDGYITIKSTAPEAYAAAQIVQVAQQLLQEKVTEYKIVKARQTLSFIEDMYKVKEKIFNTAQSELALFRDRNLNLESAMAITQQEKLESDKQLSFSVFIEVAKQLENAKIKVKEDTPIFSIIEPVSIPTERSKPNKKMILVIWIFLGGIVGVGWVFGKQFLQEVGKKWREKN